MFSISASSMPTGMSLFIKRLPASGDRPSCKKCQSQVTITREQRNHERRLFDPFRGGNRSRAFGNPRARLSTPQDNETAGPC
jgi:hypothetical protein